MAISTSSGTARLFNAENYFLHANDTPGNIASKPRSTVNEFGVSVGGPIRTNKLFFFAHYEGIRIALPFVSPSHCHSPAYQQYVLGQLAIGGTDPITGTVLPAQPASAVLSHDVFAVTQRQWNRRSARSWDAPTRTQWMERVRKPTPGVAEQQGQRKPHRSQDRPHHQCQRTASGIGSSRTPACRPHIPIRSTHLQLVLTAAAAHARLGYTHVFSPALVNQFNPGASWYSSIFEPNNYAAGAADLSDRADGRQRQRALYHDRRQQQYLSAGPQGDPVADQRQPDLDAGKHTSKFGINTRRLDVSDYDLGEGTVPTVTYNDLAEFTYGRLIRRLRAFRFRSRSELRRKSRLLRDGHLQAVAKTDAHTGMRVTWNTNRKISKDLFARPAGSFLDMTHRNRSAAQSSHPHRVHTTSSRTPFFIYQPRVSAAYQLLRRTALHRGFGASLTSSLRRLRILPP